ncbi:hypothetical protein K440DRAFT_643222 [Wilcoxina mikolae CBS 423.85]|nr:hypothetical protein K440DRAFT_643222 [Wilcoxina mikolae CBS 423.85]
MFGSRRRHTVVLSSQLFSPIDGGWVWRLRPPDRRRLASVFLTSRAVSLTCISPYEFSFVEPGSQNTTMCYGHGTVVTPISFPRKGAKGKTLQKRRKARKSTVLSEIRTNFESCGEFRDVDNPRERAIELQKKASALTKMSGFIYGLYSIITPSPTLLQIEQLQERILPDTGLQGVGIPELLHLPPPDAEHMLHMTRQSWGLR